MSITFGARTVTDLAFLCQDIESCQNCSVKRFKRFIFAKLKGLNRALTGS